MAKILIVEDDPGVAATIEDPLELEKHTLDLVADGNLASEYLHQYEYDLIILDVELPGINGFDLARKFRTRGGATPILMLTGKAALEDKMTGFTAGVDDYLTKPFHPKELVVRVRAILKRTTSTLADSIKLRHLTLDMTSKQVWREAEEAKLSPLEFALLHFLLVHPGEVFSPETLLNRVWPSDSERLPDTVRSTIRKLRQKIDLPEKESLIVNVHGSGYKIIEDAPKKV